MQSRLLVIIIMVKNEAAVIEKTLIPYVNANIKNFCVFDTGSTDSTIATTQNFFSKYDIHGFIDQEPFIDFATSRNRSLELAETHFPDATFFLMIDADWYIQNAHRLIEFCENYKTHSDPLYHIRLSMDAYEIGAPRLFRASAHVRYIGAVHEVPDTNGELTVYDDVRLIVSSDIVHRRKTGSRFKNDLALLLADFEKNPLNTRTLFYLGQTYECLEDIRNAYKFYLKRSAFTNPTNAEEDSVTFFRLGYLAEHLCLVDDNFTWDIAMEHYMQAFKKRKGRIEPLLAIASYYLNKFLQIRS